MESRVSSFQPADFRQELLNLLLQFSHMCHYGNTRNSKYCTCTCTSSTCITQAPACIYIIYMCMDSCLHVARMLLSFQLTAVGTSSKTNCKYVVCHLFNSQSPVEALALLFCMNLTALVHIHVAQLVEQSSQTKRTPWVQVPHEIFPWKNLTWNCVLCCVVIYICTSGWLSISSGFSFLIGCKFQEFSCHPTYTTPFTLFACPALTMYIYT